MCGLLLDSIIKQAHKLSLIQDFIFMRRLLEAVNTCTQTVINLRMKICRWLDIAFTTHASERTVTNPIYDLQAGMPVGQLTSLMHGLEIAQWFRVQDL